MNTLMEVYKQHRELQNKYAYFLLAVAASAIALSLKRTIDSKMAYSMIPLALAVLFWGSSFFCGCRHLTYIQSALYANGTLLDPGKIAKHPLVDGHPQLFEATRQIIKDSMENDAEKSASFGKWQFRLLVYGALLFIIWHIIEMGKITINTGS